MPAATQPKPKKERKERVRFEADGIGLRVILEPQEERFGKVGKEPVPGTGLTVSFEPDGLGGQFFETDDPDLIQKMRVRNNLDRKFFEVPIPKPDSGPVLREIVRLTAQRDVDGLVKLAEAEEDTHQRDDVLESITDALEALTT